MMRYYKPRASAKGNIKTHWSNNSDWKNTIALFGDSTTWGFELKEEDLLHNVINTDKIVNNYAYPGESNVHILMRLLDQISLNGYPHMVVIGWTSEQRMAWFNGKTIEAKGGWHLPFQIKVIDKNKEQFAGYNKLLVDTVRELCRGRTKLYEWTVFDNNIGLPKIPLEDQSADGVHPGPKTIQRIARLIEHEI